jgi:acyl-CoA reductase-like NAD-dependent aldehyde dehydrogenase
MLARVEPMLALAPRALAPTRPPEKAGFERRVEHEPLGVVLDIAAWNYPLLVPSNVVFPALVAGNAVVLKHSPKTPLTGTRFEAALRSLPVPGVFAHVVVSDADASALVVDPRIDHVSFTGSVRTGRSVYRAAAERLASVGLELGGKDAAYVAEDADVDFAAENVVDGACYNAGQSCCAVERVYVHRAVHEAFLERVRKVIGAYVIGDPLDEKTTLGPLVDQRALDAVAAQVETARKDGARIVCGGRRYDSRGFFYEPTLIVGASNDSAVMREESFGPLVAVVVVDDDAQALAAMNDSRYGLTASVWTKSAERAEMFARELEVGTVFQNRCDFLDPELPWTGWKHSGIGSTLSEYGYLALTRRKSVHLRR